MRPDRCCEPTKKSEKLGDPPDDRLRTHVTLSPGRSATQYRGVSAMTDNPSCSPLRIVEKRNLGDPARWLWLILFVAATVILLAGAYGYYRHETERIRQEKYQELAAIGKLKAAQIQQWRQEWLQDVEAVAKGPMFNRAINEWLSEPVRRSPSKVLQERLAAVQQEGRYVDAVLLDLNGQELLSASGRPESMTAAEENAVQYAIANRSSVFADMHRTSTGAISITAVAPLPDPDGRPVAVVLLRSNPEFVLHPLIESWPTPSRTAETLLVRKDGDDVLFLNHLRHLPDSALSLRRPLSRHDLPAVQAVSGKQGMLQGKDYREEEVLADLRPIPDSPWFMVAKVDTSEILSEVRYRGLVTALFATLLILLAASATAYGYSRRQARIYQDLYRSEQEQREAEERFRTILYSIGDAVITTDTGGVVRQMNPAAEALTGWSEHEAVGRMLKEVFFIINQDTRQPCENPVEKVLNSGRIVGLANRTVLIGRDGTERVISDSGAPIKDEHGEMSGVVLVFRDVTARTRATEELRSREEILRGVLGASPVGILLTQDRRIKWANDSWVKMFGFGAKGEYLDQPTSMMYSSHKDYELVRKRLYDDLQHGRVSETDTLLKRRDGTVFEGNIRINLVDTSDPSKGTISAIADISERKEAAEALRASESFLNSVIDQSPYPMFITDNQGTLVRLNKALRDLLNISDEEVSGRYNVLKDNIVEEQGFMPLVKTVFERGETVRFEIKYDSSNLKLIQVARPTFVILDITIFPIKDSNGTVVNAVVQHVDITERKRAEELRREGEERFRLAWETIPDALAITDLEDGTYLDVNSGFTLLSGYDREDVIGKSSVDVPIWHDLESRRRYSSLILTEGCVKNFEARMRRKDGELRTVLMSGSLITLKGRPHILSAGNDVEELFRAEEALRVSEEKYRRIFEHSIEGIFQSTPDGRLITVNPAFARMFGYASPQEMVSEITDIALQLYAIPSDREEVKRRFDDTVPVANYEVQCRHKDGTPMWISFSARSARDESGRIIYYEGMSEDITARKQAEEALRRSESLLREAQKVAQIGHWEIDSLTAAPRWSEEIFHIFGLDPARGEPSSFSAHRDLIHPEDWELLHGSWIKSLSEGVPFDIEIRCVRPDKSIRWINVKGYPAGKRKEESFWMFGTVQDITERRQVQERLRESEELYRAVFDNAGMGIDLLDREGRIAKANRALLNMLGYSEEELRRLSFLDVTHPEDKEISRRNLKALMAGEVDSYRLEKRYVKKDGDIVWADLWCNTVRGENGQHAGTVAVIDDISERKKAEEALRQSEGRYRLLVENVNDAIFVAQDGFVKSPNHRLALMTGYGLSELAERPFTEFVHPEDADMVLNRHKLRVKGTSEHASEYQFRLLRKDGSPIWVELGVTLIEWEGRPATLNVLRDVTERKRADEALQASEQKYRTLFEDSLDALFIVTADGTLIDANQAYFDLFGYEKEEILGHSVLETYVDPADRQRYHEALLAKGFVKDYPLRLVRKDGRQLDCILSTRIERDQDGNILVFRGFIRDTTEQKKLQTQLLQAQKMEAIGTLAGGIAHDFNNLLTVVQGFSELLLAEKDKEHPDCADLRKICRAANNGAELVKQLLMFSRKSEPKPVPINLNSQIVQIEKILRRTIPRMVDISFDLSPDLPRINADPSQVEQVLMNLAVNARDAMPDIGKLTVRTSLATLDEDYCESNIEAVPGEYVLLEVSDTGHGMDRETVGHIFEPFFTTKEMGRGTGLGLAMVYGIVKQHNGYISVYSKVGIGTTFKVYLPTIPGSVEMEVRESGIVPAFGTETLLLVDDEDLVRELGVRILTKHGYTVLQAENGRKALDLFEKESSRIALVILDLIMPEMGGTECLKELLRIHRQAKVLVASGYSSDSSVKETIQIGAKGFVSKPFRAEELLHNVRKVLDTG